MFIGIFHIRGQRNYLPPMSLEMGFGIMFYVDDLSVAKHQSDDKSRLTSIHNNEDTISVLSEAMDKYGFGYENGYGNDNIEIEMMETINEENEIEDDEEEVNENLETEMEETINGVASVVLVTELELTDEDSDEVENEVDNYGSIETKQSQPQVHLQNQKQAQAQTQTKKLNSKVNKRKLKKYAEQDDEDRELAMISLGHGSRVSQIVKETETQKSQVNQNSQSKSNKDKTNNQNINQKVNQKAKGKGSATNKQPIQLDYQTRKLKSGINAIEENLNDILINNTKLSINIRNIILNQLKLKSNDIAKSEIELLEKLNETDTINVLKLFEQGLNEREVLNKSGFLAGIIRRYAKYGMKSFGNENQINIEKETTEKQIENETLENQSISKELVVRSNQSEIECKIETEIESEAKIDVETEAIAEVEEIEVDSDEELELELENDMNHLICNPYPDDKILYAVPVCAPYLSMQNFKYRVKLTPGKLFDYLTVLAPVVLSVFVYFNIISIL